MLDGTVSLYPSVGNWKYACKSHYWIRQNRVIDAAPMDALEIEAVQQRDRQDRDRYISRVNAQFERERRMNNLSGRTRSLFVLVLRRLKALWRR
jgi:hypothetical protein